ncbi:hypothetical protein LCI18_013869 [Fusarium solani-melongenae]|uniref:Uncharacterized protein n=1 Tax=Fusarium solani subsp. cucurbitae TaxID=2747967 RepID=A0ACD3ZNS5_FUSSC|nr:hypothetical protein LCI18_013869 [Fusarium solani-melongenae]
MPSQISSTPTASENVSFTEALDLVAYNTSLSDEPFEVNKAFHLDPDPRKVNLSIGVFRSEQGEPWPLPVVQKAEHIVHQERDPSRHEYIGIVGDEEFLSTARDLAFGFNETTNQQHVSRVVSVQAISGTGANHLGATLIARRFKPVNVWLPDPTWSNHYTIWDFAGIRCRPYPFYNNAAQLLDLQGMLGMLSTQAQKGDAIVLHACAHNPTGTDPTQDEWKKIAQTCQRLGLIVLFDSAYQGFATGDVDADAWAVRYFFHQKLDICVAQSFSKNFGLYGQRVGVCHVALADPSTEDTATVLSELTHFIRAEYSMAPRWGSAIVKRVLRDPALRRQWNQDLASMSGRIRSMREALHRKLVDLQTPGSWDHLLSQVGMFSYTGLDPGQVSMMRQKHHVYMLQSGRISLSGLRSENVSYVATTIDDVVRNTRRISQ